MENDCFEGDQLPRTLVRGVANYGSFLPGFSPKKGHPIHTIL
jgi:hypothetical protein